MEPEPDVLYACEDRVQFLAGEFGVPVAEMSACSLDAGLAFVRARILTPDATYFSPSPVADCGWDVMAAEPTEEQPHETHSTPYLHSPSA